MYNIENCTNDSCMQDAPKTPGRSQNKTGRMTPSCKGDRFIPNRSAMDLDISHFNLTKEDSKPDGPLTPSKEDYKDRLADTLFDGKMKESKIFAFKEKAPAAPKDHLNQQRVVYSSNISARKPSATRHIPQNAERILDAPNLVDDYYLNLVEWSKQNILAIALSNTVYLWNASSGQITQLMKTEQEENIITSVSWTKEGRYIAVGTNDGNVELWDSEVVKPLRILRGHAARVGSLAWNEHLLSSGSRDTTIRNCDVRVQNYLVSTYREHTQEICGLKWSDDGTQLASGGNDNTVNIWDAGAASARCSFTDHQAAVKAVAWCPWQKDLLATGGGTADRCIRFWNTHSGTCVNTIDTGSQVSSLMWAKNCRELISGHGYAQNQLTVWKYPSLVKSAELRGHEQRILHLAMSPDSKTIVSAAADETLRFWKVFDVDTNTSKPKQQAPGATFRTLTISVALEAGSLLSTVKESANFVRGVWVRRGCSFITGVC